MGRRLPKFDAETIAWRIAQGYGQGTGANYKPWLSFGDVSTKGVATRLWSPKLDRPLTFFSNVERNAFFIAESLEGFLDYHEQGPMDVELTLAIARDLGVRHPRYFGTRLPAVLTYDGMLYVAGKRPQLIDCKHSGYKPTRRDEIAYAIRHEYARRTGCSIIRVTDRSYTWQRIHNLQWIRMSVAAPGKFPMAGAQIDHWSTKLFVELARALTDCERDSVSNFLDRFSRRHGQDTGIALLCLRRLLWEHHIGIDLDVHYDWLLSGPVRDLRLAHPIASAVFEAA
jgi:hypothetical protein